MLSMCKSNKERLKKEVQDKFECRIMGQFVQTRTQDWSALRAVPRPGKSKKADWGSSEGRAPSRDAVQERRTGRPLGSTCCIDRNSKAATTLP